MDSKFTFRVSDFEGISESQENGLIGGFSQSFSSRKEIEITIADNNCSGGNCVSGCGGNNACNTVVGCGKVE